MNYFDCNPYTLNEGERIELLKDFVVFSDYDGPLALVTSDEKTNKGKLFGLWFGLDKFKDYTQYHEACKILLSDEDSPNILWLYTQNLPKRVSDMYNLGYKERAFEAANILGTLTTDEKEGFEQFIELFDSLDYDRFNEYYVGKYLDKEHFADSYISRNPSCYDFYTKTLGASDMSEIAECMFECGFFLYKNGHVFIPW